MSDKPPVFTVTDRRKFTLEGDLREEAHAQEQEESQHEPKSEPSSEPKPGPRLVSTPSAPKVPEAEQPEAVSAPEPDEAATDQEDPPEISEQDEAAARKAYQQSSEHIETLLRAANPAAGAPPPVTIEHVIQSIYLSAVVALGAATEPGQQPRIDIIGARQSIDMLGVLQEKTKGNLSEKEERLLQNALFEVRMMFLEVTNAIAQQAQRPPQGKK
ncbi:MAG TPA: DUF1844 domain-containing protein [Acidobacteriaceae bacterium]|nr:DUF1844 domain-containing protein [Acidobacteriaceae bacterium]